MQTFPAQFVFPPLPAELLVFLVVVLVIWVVVRVIIDAKTWFKDEILDAYRDSTKNSEKPPIEERTVEDVFSEDRRVEGGMSNDQQTRFPKRP
ncbi:MAG: hypothetical protein GXY83_38615 [Rhodopirellula sp.]|nr:hypothetical protein [Rhodopirellula sp.]